MRLPEPGRLTEEDSRLLSLAAEQRNPPAHSKSRTHRLVVEVVEVVEAVVVAVAVHRP